MKTNNRVELEVLEKRLHRHVEVLAGDIGERNVFRPEKLHEASSYIQAFWEEQDLDVLSQGFDVGGVQCENLSVEIKGKSRAEEIVLLGAHYDSVMGSPGANDNGSAVAALFEISAALAQEENARTLWFVAFVNEEPPFFQTGDMGSAIFAKECARKGEKIHAMISMDEIGYFTDQPGSQNYPPLFNFFYPSVGNFIGIAGNLSSGKLVKLVKQYFKDASDFPLESIVAPRVVPGIDWSDHASFWDQGYPAVMITDTAPYRYPYYHTAEDLPHRLNYPALTQVTHALSRVVRRLATEQSLP